MKRFYLFGFWFWLTVLTAYSQITLLKDITPGSNSGNPEKFILAHSIVFFIGENGYLWATDGTSVGTQRVGKLATSNLFSANGQLYIPGIDYGGPGSALPGKELYKFDMSAGNYV